MLLLEEAEEMIADLNDESSELSRQYRNWKKLNMTKKMVGLVSFLSSPDRAVGELTNVRGTGVEVATLTLGYVMGKSHALTDLMTLDSSVDTAPAAIEDEYKPEGDE